MDRMGFTLEMLLLGKRRDDRVAPFFQPATDARGEPGATFGVLANGESMMIHPRS